MQINATTNFARGWDDLAISQWTSAQNEYAVLSNVPEWDRNYGAAGEGTETATMIATTTTIKTKVTAAAWRQRGGQRGGIAAAAAALLQCSVSGGSTINNQLKPSVAMA